jgi:hypothetical protein
MCFSSRRRTAEDRHELLRPLARPYDLRRFGSFQTLVGRAAMSVAAALLNSKPEKGDGTTSGRPVHNSEADALSSPDQAGGSSA